MALWRRSPHCPPLVGPLRPSPTLVAHTLSNLLSCHLRWVADRLGSARGWAQLPSLAVASASGRCLSVNYELTSAGIREAIELATPQRQRQAQQQTTPPRCPAPLPIFLLLQLLLLFLLLLRKYLGWGDRHTLHTTVASSRAGARCGSPLVRTRHPACSISGWNCR